MTSQPNETLSVCNDVCVDICIMRTCLLIKFQLFGDFMFSNCYRKYIILLLEFSIFGVFCCHCTILQCFVSTQRPTKM